MFRSLQGSQPFDSPRLRTIMSIWFHGAKGERTMAAILMKATKRSQCSHLLVKLERISTQLSIFASFWQIKGSSMMDQPRGTTAFLTSCQCNNGKNGIPELWGYNLLQGNNRLALSHQGFSILCGETHCDTNSSLFQYPCMDGTKKHLQYHLGYILKIESAKSCHFGVAPHCQKESKDW